MSTQPSTTAPAVAPVTALDLPLFPPPRCVAHLDRQRRLNPGPWRRISCAGDDADCVRRFFAAAGVASTVAIDPALRAGQLRLGEGRLVSPAAPAAGYALVADDQGLALAAADRPGLFAGLQSLWQLLTTSQSVPAFAITDWPALGTRSFQIDLGRQPESAAELCRLLRQQARYHYNQCQLYLENSLQLEAFADAADPDGLSPADFALVQQCGADLGIDVVPSLNLLGHMEKLLQHPRFAHLSEMAHGARHPRQPGLGCLCPELPESRQWIARIIDETARLSRSPELMVGLDECWSLGSHPLTRQKLDADGGAGTIFRDWIRFLHREATAGGKRMWMWEDMLFYHHGAVGQIPGDIGMMIWHYQHIEQLPQYSFQNWRRHDSLGELARHGHPLMLSCGPEAHHLHSMIRYGQGQPLLGLLVVQWEGSSVVQELFHLGRAASADVLWRGQMPSHEAAARAVTDCDQETARQIGEKTAWQLTQLPTLGGGSSHCPRFWSWPQNAATLPAKEALASAWHTLSAGKPPLEIVDLFLQRERISLSLDVARETAALTIRQMCRHHLTHSPILDQAIAQTQQAALQARALIPQAQRSHDAYTAGIRPRAMVKGFEHTAHAAEDLLARLQRFQADPRPANWPFAAVSLHLDGLTLDACAHSVVVDVSAADTGPWQRIFEGQARLPATLEGPFIMSMPLEQFPRRVRLEVGGFASLGVTRVRVETVQGPFLAQRVVAQGGYCRHPEHLLAFDQRLTIFNPPEVMPNWLAMTPPAENYVVLEFDETRPW